MKKLLNPSICFKLIDRNCPYNQFLHEWYVGCIPQGAAREMKPKIPQVKKRAYRCVEQVLIHFI